MRANTALHAHFALAAWSLAVNTGSVQDFDPEKPGTLCLPDLLKSDEQRQRVELSLAHSEQIADADVQDVADGLPRNMIDLRLSFSSCPCITDIALQAIGMKLPQGLRFLRLDFSNCIELSDSGVRMLVQRLPESLRHLELHLSHCGEIGQDGVQAISKSLPAELESLHVTLVGTRVNTFFTSPSALRRWTGGDFRFLNVRAVGGAVMNLPGFAKRTRSGQIAPA